MGRRLTKKQKAKNKALYNRIRRAWEKTDRSITYKQFKKLSMDYSKGFGKDMKEAIRHISETGIFKDADQRGREHLIKKLKEDFRPTYDELRRRISVMKKGETLPDRLEWDKDKQMYRFLDASGNEHWIDISNSPMAAYIL